MANVTAISNSASSQTAFGGGVVFLDTGSSATVVDSYFEKNIGFRGGAFFVSALSTLNVSNTVFRNGATYNSRGGDIHVNGGQLTWIGGASYGSYETIDFINQNQTLQGASGGSISLLGGSASISNIYFEGQRVSYFGAVLYSFGPTMITLTNITTNDTQTLRRGGVFYILDNGNLNIQHAQIQNAVAVEDGGVLVNLGTLNMNSINVYNTTAMNGSGGFLYDGNGALTTLNNLNVSTSQALNETTGLGGGKYLETVFFL